MIEYNDENIKYNYEINIFLDDIRKCPVNFILAKTKFICANLLDNNKTNILSLDHDLGDISCGNGYDVAIHIVEMQEINNINIWPKEIFIHTDNPVGRNNMYKLLTRYAPDEILIHHYPLE